MKDMVSEKRSGVETKNTYEQKARTLKKAATLNTEQEEEEGATATEETDKRNLNINIDLDTLDCGVCYMSLEAPIYQYLSAKMGMQFVLVHPSETMPFMRRTRRQHALPAARESLGGHDHAMCSQDP